MNKKWSNGDSAREMASKYNQLVGSVEELTQNSENSEANLQKIEQNITDIEQDLDNMVTSEPVLTISEHSDEDIYKVFKKN